MKVGVNVLIFLVSKQNFFFDFNSWKGWEQETGQTEEKKSVKHTVVPQQKPLSE